MVPTVLAARKFTALEDHENDFTGQAVLGDSSSCSLSMHSTSFADNNLTSREVIHVTQALLSHTATDTKKKLIKMLAKDYGVAHHPNQSRIDGGYRFGARKKNEPDHHSWPNFATTNPSRRDPLQRGQWWFQREVRDCYLRRAPLRTVRP